MFHSESYDIENVSYMETKIWSSISEETKY